MVRRVVREIGAPATVEWKTEALLTRTRDCTINPMKLLLCAILADSLIDMEQ